MILKVRTHPITVYYCTGGDAAICRSAAEQQSDAGDAPCFVTESFGDDGFTWDSPEQFESEWADGPGDSDPSFDKYRRQSA